MNRNFLRLYALTRFRTPMELVHKLREELETENYLELKQYILDSAGGIIDLPTKLEEIMHLYFAKAAIEKENGKYTTPDWGAMYVKLKELYFYEGTKPLIHDSYRVEKKDILEAEKDAILSKITMKDKAFINDESIHMAKKELFHKVESLKHVAIEEALQEWSNENFWVVQQVKEFFANKGQDRGYSKLSDEDMAIVFGLKKEILNSCKNISNKKEAEYLKAELIKQINTAINAFIVKEMHEKTPSSHIEGHMAKATAVLFLMQKAWVFIEKYFELNNWGLPSLKFMEILMNIISGNDVDIRPSSPYIYTTIDIHSLIKDYEILYLREKLQDLGLEDIDQEMEKDHFFDYMASLQELLKKHPATTIRLDTTDYRPKKPGKKKDESQLNLKISALADEATEVNTVLYGEKKLVKEFLTYQVHIDKYIDGSVEQYDINKHEKRKNYVYELHSIMEETGLDDIEEYAEVFNGIKQQMQIYKKKARES